MSNENTVENETENKVIGIEGAYVVEVSYTTWEKIVWSIKKKLYFNFIEPIIEKIRNKFTDGGFKKSAIYTHMIRELELIGYDVKKINDDDVDSFALKAILELGETFYKQRHSGFSASYVLSVTNKLLSYKTLSPLQGTDDEWLEVGDGLLQNVRDSTVFRDTQNEVTYYLDAYVFEEKDGGSFTSFYSRKEITEFPFIVPKYEVIDADDNGEVPESFKERWRLENPSLAEVENKK